jgi:hypothetical protein
LWNRKLLTEEINCIIDTKISLASQGLQVYLDFNDGQADGDNTAIPALIDQASGSSTTISDMALTGSTSNFTSGVNNYTTINSTYCGTAFSFGSQIIDAPGIYYDAFLVAGACDSLVALNVTDNSVDVSVTANNNYLLANAASGNYQWINCSTNAAISGAVNQSYIPSVNGEYAVIVTQNFCSDTSDCINFTTAGFDNLIVQELEISPNPAQGYFQIGLPFWAVNAELSMFDLTGKKVHSKIFTGNQTAVVLSENVHKGLYFAVINYNGNRAFGKIVVY